METKTKCDMCGKEAMPYFEDYNLCNDCAKKSDAILNKQKKEQNK